MGVSSTIEPIHSNDSVHKMRPLGGLKIVFPFPKLKTSAKSVQTTRVVCTNYG